MRAIIAGVLLALAGSNAARAQPTAIDDGTLVGTRQSLCVAVSSDGMRIVVGSPDERVAHVMRRDASGWVTEAILPSSWGLSVGISGDGTYAMVVADGSLIGYAPTANSWAAVDAIAITPQSTNIFALSRDGRHLMTGGYPSGALVHTYGRSASGWVLEGTSDGASIGGPTAHFGSAVAISADGTRAIAGADWSGASHSGAVLVLRRDGTTWTEEARLHLNTPVDQALLGWSVAISDDGATVAAGAPNAITMPSGTRTGAVYVFGRSGTSWHETTALVLADGVDADEFGFAVALAENGDRLLVTAIEDDTTIGTDTGGVRMFSRSGGSYVPEASFVPAGARALERWGGALAVSLDARVGVVTSVGPLMFDPTLGLGAHVFTFASCRSTSDCTGGACVLGVCCDRACDGACEACAMWRTGVPDGTCGPIVANAAMVCRAASGACDVAETCDGASTTCPSDAVAPDGSACDDGLACTSADVCAAGACRGAPLACDDHDPCTVDRCIEPSGCAHAPTTCDDASSMALVDAASDGATPSPRSASCGCGAVGHDGRASLAAVLALALLGRRARRTRGRSCG